MMSWREAKEQFPNASLVVVREKDLRPFSLPIPGAWQMILKSKRVPTVDPSTLDRSMPIRELVYGIQTEETYYALRKGDLMDTHLYHDPAHGLVFLGSGTSMKAFQLPASLRASAQLVRQASLIIDLHSPRKWDLEGNSLTMMDSERLRRLPIGEWFWFAWKKYRPSTNLLEVKASFLSAETALAI